MGRAWGTGGVWLLSCLPIALPTFYPPAGISLGNASILALAAIPWIAWSGLPRQTSESPSTSPIVTGALALPPLAAALALDVGRGSVPGTALLAALACVAMIAILGCAAQRSSFARGPVRAFDVAWIALVPGFPVLRCALELGGAPAYGSAPGWLAFLASLSPIGWALRPTATPWPAVGVCVLLLLVSRVGSGSGFGSGTGREEAES